MVFKYKEYIYKNQNNLINSLTTWLSSLTKRQTNLQIKPTNLPPETGNNHKTTFY